MTTHTEEFDRRVVVQKYGLTKDEELNEVGVWTDVYKCFAGVITSGGNATADQSREDYNTALSVKLRYCKRAAEIVPDTYRVIIAGVPYIVKEALDVNLAHQIVRLRVVRDSGK